MPNPFDVPVILLVFNRPEHTRRLLEQVRAVRPAILLVVADGPRADRPEEPAACAAVRHVIEEMVDWQPRLLTHYAETNLGLRQRVSSGLTWAFHQVERGIVLEDDCVPDPSFFRFCGELLQHYENDPRVGVITGNNFQASDVAGADSYYFSRYNHCWGWATWRRAWHLFDADMQNWPARRDSGWLSGLFPDAGHARYWENLFEGVHQRKIGSWAYAWTFSCWSQNLLTIIPKANLVANIGFGAGATHTGDAASPWHDLPTRAMEFPLRHPAQVQANRAADEYTQRVVFGSTRARRWKLPRFSGSRLWAKLLGRDG